MASHLPGCTLLFICSGTPVFLRAEKGISATKSWVIDNDSVSRGSEETNTEDFSVNCTPLTNKDVSVRRYFPFPLLNHILHSVFPPLLKVIHSSLCGSIVLPVILLLHPPIHFSFCCKYRGLNGMMLYLDGRCAIMWNRLNHNHTQGPRLEACCVLSLPLFCF